MKEREGRGGEKDEMTVSVPADVLPPASGRKKRRGKSETSRTRTRLFFPPRAGFPVFSVFFFLLRSPAHAPPTPPSQCQLYARLAITC